MRVILLCLLLAWSVPVCAQPPVDAKDSPLLLTGLATYLAASSAELATTVYAIGRGAGQEGNPVVARFAHAPLAVGAMKMGIAAGTAYFLLRVHRTHPKLATGLSWALAGTTSALALSNAHGVPR